MTEVHSIQKRCSVCAAEKPLTEFRRDKRKAGGFGSWCRACDSAKQKRRRDTPEYKEQARAYRSTPQAKASERVRWLKYASKLVNVPYEEIAASQGEKCAICNQPESRPIKRGSGIRRLALDHCHKTGKVRGLLCGACNTGIGHFKDDPALLAAAIAYLHRHSRKSG